MHRKECPVRQTFHNTEHLKSHSVINPCRYLRLQIRINAAAIGIAGSYLHALHNKGVLERPSRGLYTLPNSEPSEFRSIVEACSFPPMPPYAS